MNDKMLEIYSTIINNLILQVAQQHTGFAANQLGDTESFRRNLSNTAWNQLPVPLRLMGRDQLRWDMLNQGLASELFATTADGRLMVRPDAAQRLEALVGRVMGAPGGYAPQPMAPAMPMAAPPGPIMAMPVGMAPPVAPLAPPMAAPARPVPPPLPPAAAAPPPMRTAVAAPIPAAPPKPAPKPDTPSSRIPLGIDLGTTYSVVAYLDPQGRPTSIANAVGDLVTPSIVLFDEAGPIVGKEAMMAAAMEPDKVAVCVKRDMGSKSYRRTINGESLPPEVISSIILKALLTDARRRLGPDVAKAVITVPAYFDELRRRATTDAGRLAGLDVLDIINEPTAAALAYGYQLGFLDATGANSNAKPIRILVYDLGGGTFDVTIVEIQGNNFKALATDGDVTLGGKDFDEAIVNLAAEKFMAQYRDDPRQNPNSLMDLFMAAEVVKKTLSERTKASLYVSHNGRRMKVDITREEFDEITSPLVSRTKTTTEIVVRQSGLTWAAIDRVLLVGGSSRMPSIPAMLEKLSGKPVDRSVSPDEAVAHGAALYAGLLIKKGTPQAGPPAFNVVNINSHSLGIIGVDPATGRKKNQILIPKNSPLPRKIAKTFKTNKPGQAAVVIRVVEGESERPEACIQVGVCTVSNLPPNLPQGTPVQVVYSYEENGQLEVTAQVQGSQAIRTVFKRENNLENDQAAMWAQYLASLEART